MNRLRELRKSRGLSLSEFSSAIHIPMTTLDNYELGSREPQLKTWKLLANFYGVSVSYVMGLDEPIVKKQRLHLSPIFGAVTDQSGRVVLDALQVEAVRMIVKDQLQKEGQQRSSASLTEEQATQLANEVKTQVNKVIRKWSDPDGPAKH